jgi:dihydropyrimidine dehydrogenase (NAD+) subunit PreA
VGKSLHRIADFNDFDLSFRAVARIDAQKCIKCNLCYVACNDTAHQCIDLVDASGRVAQPYSYSAASNGKYDAVATRPQPVVREDDCVGCRLCFNICPVEGCIEMPALPPGGPPVTWAQLVESEPAVTEDWEAMKRYRERMGIHIH